MLHLEIIFTKTVYMIISFYKGNLLLLHPISVGFFFFFVIGLLGESTFSSSNLGLLIGGLQIR